MIKKTVTMGNTNGITDNTNCTRPKYPISMVGGRFELNYFKKQDSQTHQFIFLFVIQKNSSTHSNHYSMIMMAQNKRLIGWTKLLNRFNSLNWNNNVFVLDGNQCTSCNDHDYCIITIITIIFGICCIPTDGNMQFPPYDHTQAEFEQCLDWDCVLQ